MGISCFSILWEKFDGIFCYSLYVVVHHIFIFIFCEYEHVCFVVFFYFFYLIIIVITFCCIFVIGAKVFIK